MFFETKKDLRQKIEWLNKDIEIYKDISNGWKNRAIFMAKRINMLQDRNNFLNNNVKSTRLELNQLKRRYKKLEKELKESDDLLVEKRIENKKLKEEIKDMKPKRNFDVGQLIEYRGDVYEVAYQMNVCVALRGINSNVKCNLITVDRNSSELIKL